MWSGQKNLSRGQLGLGTVQVGTYFFSLKYWWFQLNLYNCQCHRHVYVNSKLTFFYNLVCGYQLVMQGLVACLMTKEDTCFLRLDRCHVNEFKRRSKLTLVTFTNYFTIA